MDIFAKMHHDENMERVAAAKEMGLYPYFLPLEDTEGTEVTMEGRKIIMIGSNNYLGLTTHPKVREAAIAAIKQYGTSCTGSRFLNGTLKMHLEAEEKLAAFVGKEAALMFATGMQSNLGAISAVLGRDDVVVIDKDDHASIVDACRLGFGKMVRFIHNDLSSLERQLKAVPSTLRRAGHRRRRVQHGRRHRAAAGNCQDCARNTARASTSMMRTRWACWARRGAARPRTLA